MKTFLFLLPIIVILNFHFILNHNVDDNSLEENIKTINKSCSPDFETLMALYNATNGENWTNQWDTADCSCQGWYGVTLDEQGFVTVLNLFENNLDGPLPDEIGDLLALRALYLDFNKLNGTLPSSIGNLSNLTHLGISSNQFTGNIPAEFTNLNNVVNVYAGRNQFSGNIPGTIGNMTRLREINLANNQLTGPIPASMLSLPNLESFVFEFNQLSGSLPDISSLPKIFYINLGYNNFTGSIPEVYGNKPFFALYLNNNNLSGCFPSSLLNLCGTYSYFHNNPLLPGGGNFASFCEDRVGECSQPCIPPAKPIVNTSVSQSGCTLFRASILITNKTSTDSASFNGGITYQIGDIKNVFDTGSYTVIIKSPIGCLSEPTTIKIKLFFPPDTNCNGIDEDCDGTPDDDYIPGHCQECKNGSVITIPDADNDGICNDRDNCTLYNPDQADADCDGVGDLCDKCPGGNDKIDKDQNGMPDCAYPPASFNLFPSTWQCSNKSIQKLLVCALDPILGWTTNCVNFKSIQNQIKPGKQAYCGPCNEAKCSAIQANLETRELPSSKEDLNIYPNPTKGTFLVEINNQNIHEGAKLLLYNTEGKIVWSSKINSSISSISLPGHLVNGIYILSVNTTPGIAPIYKRIVLEK